MQSVRCCASAARDSARVTSVGQVRIDAVVDDRAAPVPCFFFCMAPLVVLPAAAAEAAPSDSRRFFLLEAPLVGLGSPRSSGRGRPIPLLFGVWNWGAIVVRRTG